MAGAKKKTKTLRVKKQSSTTGGAVAARRAMALLVIVAFLGGLGVLAVKGARATGRFLFSSNPQFTIRSIDISSDGGLPVEWLLGQADVEYGDNLFAVTSDDIQRELKRVPKIKSVSVRRQLPDHLVVDVKERFAVAQISFNAKSRYPQTIDPSGVVLAPAGGTEKLPLIYGVADFDDPRNLRPGTSIKTVALHHALDVISLCNSTTWGRMIKVASIDAAYQDFIKVYLDDDTLVYVPQTRLEILEGKMRRLAAVLQIANEKNEQVASVDLTSDGINVTVKYR